MPDRAEALAIARAVADALAHAHGRGVIHRDIKPENILLQEGEAVLTDFGIALAVKEAGGNRLTETGLSLGTPQYMSPEQATGDRTLDARSDIYSLAAVLYEMLAGEPPVTGPNAQAMMAKLMTERPVRLGVVRDSVPGSVDAAVTRALSKVPADRFTTAGEFARSLVATSTVSPANASTRPRWLMVGGVGVAALALGTAAAVSLRSRPAPMTTFTPRFEQLTTDGNARRPALSPDGTRLAYVARDCDERERCIDRLVVRDIGNAASITVFTNRHVEIPSWAADGRFLTAMTDQPLTAVVVPALGGSARPLPGYAPAVVGTTDTVIVTRFLATRDSLGWLQIVTASDGLVRDSIPIRQPTLFHRGYPASQGGRIALLSFPSAGTVLSLIDRTGRVTDSLPTFAGTLRSVQWTPRADAVVVQLDLREGNSAFVPFSAAAVPAVLVRYRVSADGKFVGAPDTLMTMERGSFFDALRPDGSALVEQGPVEAAVYALERSGVDRLDFRSRRLTASTAGVRASISQDGTMVWLKYGGSGGSPQRNTFVPFGGGAELPFTLPPGVEISTDWTVPASTGLLYVVRDSAGKMRLVEIEVATGRSRAVMELPPRTASVFGIEGGGYGLVDIEAHSARIVGRPGKPDTTWSVPAIPGRLYTAPLWGTIDHGRAFLEFSMVAQSDTGWIRKVPVDGGAASPAVPVRWDKWIGVFPDGSFETVLSDSTGLGWYRIAPGRQRSVRLGSAPVQGLRTEWSGSNDGLRFVVVKPVDRPDVYLLRNFGELLKR
jgi:hypothetical protein